MKVAIVIPVYNEEKTIEDVLQKVLNLTLEKEIIVVDDGSTDNTWQRLLAAKKRVGGNLKILRHAKNRGKGAAIRTALSVVEAEAVIIQDADLEYNPEQIPYLVETLKNNPGLVAVYGSRFLQENPRIYWHYYLGNKFVTKILNLVFRAKFSDSYTGYKLVRSEVLRRMNLRSKRFEVEAEISAKLAREGHLYQEVPINYLPRRIEEGKKIKLIDAFKGILTIILCRLKIW